VAEIDSRRAHHTEFTLVSACCGSVSSPTTTQTLHPEPWAHPFTPGDNRKCHCTGPNVSQNNSEVVSAIECHLRPTPTTMPGRSSRRWLRPESPRRPSPHVLPRPPLRHRPDDPIAAISARSLVLPRKTSSRHRQSRSSAAMSPRDRLRANLESALVVPIQPRQAHRLGRRSHHTQRLKWMEGQGNEVEVS
jgi:hypothetical protein